MTGIDGTGEAAPLSILRRNTQREWAQHSSASTAPLRPILIPEAEFLA